MLPSLFLKSIKAKYPIECACTGTDEKMFVYITDESFSSGVKDELVAKTKLVATAFEIRVRMPRIPQKPWPSSMSGVTL